MEGLNSLILPHILENLSQKPEMSDTYDNLCNEIEEVLSSENLTGNIRKAIRKALDVGQNLGIISFTNKIIRVPFNFRTTAQNSPAPAILEKDDQQFDAVSVCEYCHSTLRKQNSLTSEESEHAVTQAMRPRRVVPNMLPHGISKRKRSRSSGGRRRHSKSNRRGSVRRRRSSSRRGGVRRRSK